VSKTGVKISSKKLFFDRVIRQRSFFETKGWDSELLQRLCSDERARKLWDHCARLDEGNCIRFLSGVRFYLHYGSSGPSLQQKYRGRQVEAAELQKMTRRLITMYEGSPVFDMPSDLKNLETVASWRPGVLVGLKKVEEMLLSAVAGWKKRGEEFRNLSRKGPRGDAIRALATFIKMDTGKPNYDLVATIASVVYDDDLTADAVRKSVSRKTGRLI
jgi:hypothetical protein